MKSPDQAAFKAILVVTMIIAIAMLPVVAKAEPYEPKGPSALFELDVDADGFVSEDEFNDGMEKRRAAAAEAGKPVKDSASAPSFTNFDTDGDGKLTQEELASGQKARKQAARAQNQGKGKKMTAFADIDTDDDGCINADEFAQHQAKRQGKQAPTDTE